MLPTCAVSCTVHDQAGRPEVGATVTARLSSYEVYQGYVVPEVVTATTDAYGVCVLNLWPNQLGAVESLYNITITPTAGRALRTTATVPNQSSAQLHLIAELPPYDGKTDGQLILDEAVAAAAIATAKATEADASADASAVSAIESGNSATSSGQSKVAAESAADQAAIYEAQAKSHATTAGAKAGESTASATSAAASAAAADNSEDAAALSAAAAAASKTAAETAAASAESDRIQTGLDAEATAADRVQTGLDRTAAASSETAAEAAAATATTKAAEADASADAALAIYGNTTVMQTAVNTATTAANTATTKAAESANSATQAAASAANAAAIVTGVASNRASIRPSLLLDFANTKQLDPRVTFSRASTGTYYDGKTVVKAEENLMLFSEQFDNAAWSTENVVKTANVAVAPDGTLSADLMADTATAALHRSAQTLSFTTGIAYTFSVYAKNNTLGYIQLLYGSNSFDANAYANFDLATGALGTVGSAATATITSFGNGWYRCSITCTSTATAANAPQVVLIQSATAPRAENYSGTGKSIYLWGAQLEQRSTATSYTPTTTAPITNYIPALQTAAAGVARFDHDPITGESKGFLVEEQRTNLLTYSDDLSNAAWGTSTTGSVTVNSVISPDGTLSADLFTEDTSTGIHAKDFPGVTFVTSTVYTATVYAKAKGSRWLELGFPATVFTARFGRFDLLNGVLGTSDAGVTNSITNVGNGWYRCSITATCVSGAGSRVAIFINNTSGSRTYTGDGYSGLYIWGAQLEAGAFPTSYIPTVASQVTRSADAASMTGSNFTSWYRADEGTVYAEGQVETNRNYSGSFRHFFQASPTSNSESSATILINGFNVPQSQIKNANVNQSDLTSGSNTGALLKLASAYKTNDFGFSTNGATVATDTSGLPAISPAIEQIRIGGVRDGNSGGQLNGTIKRLAFYPKRLSNTELQGITS